jgi:hypothetical protein
MIDLTQDEDRRAKFLNATLALRHQLEGAFDIDPDVLTDLAAECVETVLMNIGWPLSPPWWDI